MIYVCVVFGVSAILLGLVATAIHVERKKNYRLTRR